MISVSCIWDCSNGLLLLMIIGFRLELFAQPYTLKQYTMFKWIMAEYRVPRASVVMKFYNLFKQKRDLEIFAQSCVIWALKMRYSSKWTPSNLKLFSGPSLWILSIGLISSLLTTCPISLLLNTIRDQQPCHENWI